MLTAALGDRGTASCEELDPAWLTLTLSRGEGGGPKCPGVQDIQEGMEALGG